MVAARQSFFGRHALPVFDFLSSRSRQALEQYLASGASERRERQLLEFFKSVDWLPLEEITLLNGSPARKLPVAEQMSLFQDLKAYYRQKDEVRQMRRLQRQTRQRRVIEYYRQKISSPDKRLLEQLRDYELALTGRDANWQYYFALRSFRRIDAFISQAPAERLSQIAQFKRDVLAYKRNLDSGRWRDPMEDEPFLSFDEWCQHARIEDSSSATQSGRGSGGLSGDYALFQATPQTPLPAIKRQFRQLALRAHPDITGDDGAAMRRLLAAYERVRAAHRSL